jgi:hypothetical protein
MEIMKNLFSPVGFFGRRGDRESLVCYLRKWVKTQVESMLLFTSLNPGLPKRLKKFVFMFQLCYFKWKILKKNAYLWRCSKAPLSGP